MNRVLDDVFKIVEEKILKEPGFNPANYYKNKNTLRLFLLGENLLEDDNINLKLNKDSYYDKLALDETNEANKPKAIYNIDSNSIYCSQINLKNEVILHEVIHMATKKDGLNFGLMKKCKNNTALKYLNFNEGATQWLTHRTIENNDLNNTTYIVQTRIVRLLELAIGTKRFLKYFSEANFNGLNKSVVIPEVKNVINKIAYELQCFSYFEYTHFENVYNLKDEIALEETKICVTKQKESLNIIQKMLIDIFISNIDNHDYNKINEFRELLISSNTVDKRFKIYLKKVIENDNSIINYFDERVNNIFDIKQKTLVI